MARRRLSSKITASKCTIVHLVCVIIMYTIYEMYKDVVSPCSSYAIFSNTEAAGDVKRSAGGGSLLPLAEMGIAPSSVQVACMLQPFFFF